MLAMLGIMVTGVAGLLLLLAPPMLSEEPSGEGRLGIFVIFTPEAHAEEILQEAKGSESFARASFCQHFWGC